jgi:hypothetical protein
VNNFSDAGFGNKAIGFDRPTQLPLDATQHRTWQLANRSWWEASPMRYDWRQDIGHVAGTVEYFQEIDRRFLSTVRSYMPWRDIPFDAIIPFEKLRAWDVLEIGVGQGTHAQLLAPHCFITFRHSLSALQSFYCIASGSAFRVALHCVRVLYRLLRNLTALQPASPWACPPL